METPKNNKFKELKSTYKTKKKIDIFDKIKKNKYYLNKSINLNLNDDDNYLNSFGSLYLSFTKNNPKLIFDLSFILGNLEDFGDMDSEMKQNEEEIKSLKKELEKIERESEIIEVELKSKDNELEKMSQKENELQLKLVEFKKMNDNLEASLSENDTILPPLIEEKLEGDEFFARSELEFESIKVEEHNIKRLFDKDLSDYYSYIHDIMDSKQSQIETITNNLKNVFNQMNLDLKIILTGSFATHTDLPWSNIDYILVGDTKTLLDDDFFLRKLRHIISAKPWVCEYTYRDEEIILKTNELFYSFKINIDLKGSEEIHKKRNELIVNYLKENEILIPIVLSLKTIIKNAIIQEIGTYEIILLIMFFIQTKNYVLDKNIPMIRATFFLDFIHFYGNIFDFNIYPIKVKLMGEEGTNTESNALEKKTTNNLVILDPLNPEINLVGEECKTVQIKMLFLILHMSTKEACECGCHYGRATRENLEEETEHCILKKMFNAVRRVSAPN
ncbi:MAG: hypothetical protein MJ252_11770 [archaeon]|nr:hypothetical protein [archaeon]